MNASLPCLIIAIKVKDGFQTSSNWETLEDSIFLVAGIAHHKTITVTLFIAMKEGQVISGPCKGRAYVVMEVYWY